jgi:uncharacterized protein (DUF342 family)
VNLVDTEFAMYYLRHYFDPDFRHTQLSPAHEPDGAVSLRYLGYVQNVVAGQVLAELVDLDVHPDAARDSRFMYQERHLPIGPNCAPHSKNPDKIVSLVNGYVFYNEGLISVKRLLNVRSNLGFHTGNIFFVGDVAVHGDVQTGFALQAANILVKGHIESSKVKGSGDIVCLQGIRGSDESGFSDNPEKNPDIDMPLPTTLVEAGGNLRLPFCERVQLRARGNIIIDGSCLHSTIYVGGNLVIKGRLQGGTVVANGLVYVEERMGGEYGDPTRIMMGYDPFHFLKVQKIESQIAYFRERKSFFESMSARNQVMEQEYAYRLNLVTRKLDVALRKHRSLWARFVLDEKFSTKCRIVANDAVMPGCEIYIGRAFYRTVNMDFDLTFFLEDDEIRTHRNTKR